MAYKVVPMISPKMAHEFMLPGYKRITGFIKEHGVETILFDSDGNVDHPIPLAKG